MRTRMARTDWMAGLLIAACTGWTTPVLGQTVDKTQAPNTEGAGIAKSFAAEVGPGRGDDLSVHGSLCILHRDPFRSIRRGRQLFQRKFTRLQGEGPGAGDGSGDIDTNLAIGAGLADSCAACHGRPKGSAGHGGDVVTRPDSRDAPHLFGLGLKEMLADEITADLRSIRDQAVSEARLFGRATTKQLKSKRISYGFITAGGDGSIDTSRVKGVDPDLRVRPFFAHGGTISIREFIAGAMKNEMGMEVVDSDLMRAAAGARVVTPSGIVLDGSQDRIEAPLTDDPTADPDGDGVLNEVPQSAVDHLEFYLLNYFKPAIYQQTGKTISGRKAFTRIGCASCHVTDLTIDRDRRVADVETNYDSANGIFNTLFAQATPLFVPIDDGSGLPSLKLPAGKPFVVRNIFSDFKRHDLGPEFYERNYDGTLRKEFLTTALWGVGTTAPYGHDGRSVNLAEVILRHHGEAEEERADFARLDPENQDAILAFLNSLVLFPPDDTASNLDPGSRNAPNFPQYGHGSIKLGVLFNDPSDPE